MKCNVLIFSMYNVLIIILIICNNNVMIAI